MAYNADKGVEIMFNSYINIVKDFESISIKDLEEMTKNPKDQIVYMGFEACPYCNYFVPKLHEVMEKHQLEIYYVNSRNQDEISEIQSFRDKYHIMTVPTLIKVTNDFDFVSNSELTVEEIKEFLGLIG